jgi:hypothetical protein
MKAFYEALLARHKTRLQVLVAVARKMIHAIYGILLSKTPYDGRKLFRRCLSIRQKPITVSALQLNLVAKRKVRSRYMRGQALAAHEVR